MAGASSAFRLPRPELSDMCAEGRGFDSRHLLFIRFIGDVRGLRLLIRYRERVL